MKRKTSAVNRIRGHIRVCGSGWIGTGFVSITAWAFGSASVCNCPLIPAGVAPQQAASLCQCGPYVLGFLTVGLLAILIGMTVFLLSRKLEKILNLPAHGSRA